jgi:hypothetical protein
MQGHGGDDYSTVPVGSSGPSIGDSVLCHFVIYKLNHALCISAREPQTYLPYSTVIRNAARDYEVQRTLTCWRAGDMAMESTKMASSRKTRFKNVWRSPGDNGMRLRLSNAASSPLPYTHAAVRSQHTARCN